MQKQNMVVVALDAMGGDNAPASVVKGAVQAVCEKEQIKVILTGSESRIKEELSKYKYDNNRIEVVNASEFISNDEHPVEAVRKKKDASVVKALAMLKSGEADACISAGSTGALLVGAQLIAGRIKGVERAPLAAVIPTVNGFSLLIDSGANVDSRSSHLVQFAKMGSIYMEHAMGVKNPKVAIVNIGSEEEKGNALVKETYPLLKECKYINFTGNIEARNIPYGEADVIVCEAFVGNVILKLYEGLASAIVGKIKAGLTSTPISTIGAALAKPALKKTLKDFDVKKYGGAPMLGLNGLVVKVHGNAHETEIKNAIIQCIAFKEENVNGRIKEVLAVDMTGKEKNVNEG